MPMRSSMRLSFPTPMFRSGICCCTSTAQRTASTTRKFHQHAVTGGLDDPAAMLGHFRVEELAAQCFEAFERAFLVHPHQPRIPRHIGCEDCGETADCGHYSGTLALRSPSMTRSAISPVR